MSDVQAEMGIDHQHGRWVRVTIDGTSVAVYLDVGAPSAVVTVSGGGQYGLKVKGRWAAALDREGEG